MSVFKLNLKVCFKTEQYKSCKTNFEGERYKICCSLKKDDLQVYRIVDIKLLCPDSAQGQNTMNESHE